ncbi:MAG TPA: hypothetical protein VK783_05290 [Bacteroidia bacterium]|jgi:hypothetical protein|nr:hypothetical protein [Bacteroidia bacterium]
MKKNRGTLIIVVVLLLISVYFLFFNNTFSTLSGKDNEFAVKDTASITKITMVDRNKNSVTLTRINAGQWKVNDKYFVRSDAINTLLYTIKMVTVKNLIDQGGWDKVVQGLASNSVKVDIYKGDDKIKSYFVGSQSVDHLGSYMLLVNPHSDENYKQPYVTYIPGFDGFLTTRYFVIEEGWRDRTVFRYYPNEIKSVTLNYPDPSHSFTINAVAKNKYSIENPVSHQSLARFDTNAVRQYLTYFQAINWEAVVTPDKKDSIIASTPICIMDVKDTTGKAVNIRLYNRKTPDKFATEGKDYKYDPDRLYALVNGKDFVLVQYFVFGKLLQDPSYFVHK